MKEIYRRDSRS